MKKIAISITLIKIPQNFHRNLQLNSCIQLLLQDELGVVDFSNPDKVRNEINNWVLEKTKKKIKNLLPSGSLSSTNKVALVNAAYFKGNWASKFKSEDTKRDNFYVKRDVIRNTEFMKQKGKFNYYTSEELRAHVLQMPYQGMKSFSIFVCKISHFGWFSKTSFTL